jgi:hypothetical protein
MSVARFLNDLLTWVVPFLKTHSISIYGKADENPYSVSAAILSRVGSNNSIFPASSIDDAQSIQMSSIGYTL